MTTVPALVCRAPGVLAVEERPAPVAGPGEALVRPRAVGICGTDYHIFEGKHPFLSYPRIMGHELAVEVVSVPPGSAVAAGEVVAVNPYLSCGTCRTCRAGRSNCCETLKVLGVHCDGGMIGLLALPAANLVPIRGLPVEAAAVVEFLAIGAHAVQRGGTRPGASALVVGAGPIGLGTALFARLAGADVALLDIDAGRCARVAELAGVTPLSAPPAPESFDLVFDATGVRASMERSFAYAAPGAAYVFVGVNREEVTFADPDFHRRELTLCASRNAVPADFDRVIAAIRAGEVAPDRLITHRTTLAGAVADLPVWARDRGGLVKALIEIA